MNEKLKRLDPDTGRGLLIRIAKVALKPNCLNVVTFHTCATIHCIAGWACVLSKKAIASGGSVKTRAKFYKINEKEYSIDKAAGILLNFNNNKADRIFYNLHDGWAEKYLKGVLYRAKRDKVTA